MTRVIDYNVLVGIAFVLVFVSAGAIMVCLVLLQRSAIADRFIRTRIMHYVNDAMGSAEGRVRAQAEMQQAAE